MNPAAGGPREVVLDVPELDGPSFGWGCCAVTRVDVLLEEMDSWPGLLALDVDPEQALAVVLVSPGHTMTTCRRRWRRSPTAGFLRPCCKTHHRTDSIRIIGCYAAFIRHDEEP
jgi:hypothetical protein